MKRVFSYCVYGSNPKYCQGMITNIEQITKIFPDFMIYISLGSDVPQSYIDAYKEHKNVKLIYYETNRGRITAYRFFHIDDEDVDTIIVRDADSRFGDRDVWCINNFLTSEYLIFSIRDHIAHTRPMMAGLCGMKKIKTLNMLYEYTNFIKNKTDIDYYQVDQDFIAECIYNKYINVFVSYTDMPFNTETHIQIPFSKKIKSDFCGCVYLYTSNGVEYPWC